MPGSSRPSNSDMEYRIRRHILSLCLDLAAFLCSSIVAFGLQFDGTLSTGLKHPMLIATCVWAVLQSVAFLVFQVSWGHWRYTSTSDAARLLLACSAGSIASSLVLSFLPATSGIPHSVYVLQWMIACVLTLGGRLAVRAAVSMRLLRHADGTRTRTLIYGAGSAASALVLELRHNDTLKCEVIGLIDDAPRNANLNLHGIRVLGTGDSLREIVRKYDIEKILIAIPSITGQQMVRILEHVLDAQVEYKMVPSLGELVQGAELGKQVRDVAVEDLLGRKPVRLDQKAIRERIQGKVVMVTGAAGSIGSEICRQIAPFEPLALIGFDVAETPLFQIDRELRKDFPNLTFHSEIGDIMRPDSLRRVMQKFRPAIVYHAAAYKHVPMMERHVFAAVENNILGTWHVAAAAVRHGVEDFVMISTDKAVRPTSIMGTTKRIAELVIRAMQQETGTKFVAVRFGNVLGSNGSVVPIFKEQIAAGGPVTVTHPEMARYFMTIPEASQLVLQAFSMGKGGEVFVLDMGDPVKIVDLARNLILLSGLRPDRDVKVQFSGVRPGEKLFEELNLQDECLMPTSHDKIKSYISPSDVTPGQIGARLQELKRIVETQDMEGLALLLKEMIPDYQPTSQLLSDALVAASNRAGMMIGPEPSLHASRSVEALLAHSAPIP